MTFRGSLVVGSGFKTWVASFPLAKLTIDGESLQFSVFWKKITIAKAQFDGWVIQEGSPGRRIGFRHHCDEVNPWVSFGTFNDVEVLRALEELGYQKWDCEREANRGY